MSYPRGSAPPTSGGVQPVAATCCGGSPWPRACPLSLGKQQRERVHGEADRLRRRRRRAVRRARAAPGLRVRGRRDAAGRHRFRRPHPRSRAGSGAPRDGLSLRRIPAGPAARRRPGRLSRAAEFAALRLRGRGRARRRSRHVRAPDGGDGGRMPPHAADVADEPREADGRVPRSSAPGVQEAARAGAARRHRRAQDIQQRRDDPGAGSRRRPAAAPPRRRHRVRPRRGRDLRRAHRVRRRAGAGHGDDRADDAALRRRRRREHRRPHPPPRRPARAPAHVVRRGTDVGAHGVRGRGLDPPHRGLRGAGRLRARGRARRPSAATATATTVGSSSWTAASASPVAPA